VVGDVNVELDVVTGLVVVAIEVAVEVSIGNVSKEAVVVKAGGQEVPLQFSRQDGSRWVSLAK
jgi:hypothetical protein